MLQQFAAAVSCYQEVLARDSDSTTALHNKGLALILLGEFDDAEACYTRIQHMEALQPNTLAPLLALSGILSGLTDANLRIEASPAGNATRISHPHYTGGRRAVVFKGIHGNVGNVGGRNARGGEGFPGAPGVLVSVEES